MDYLSGAVFSRTEIFISIFSMIFTLIISIAAAVWVYFDAVKLKQDVTNKIMWTIATFLVPILFLPLWLLTRPTFDKDGNLIPNPGSSNILKGFGCGCFILILLSIITVGGMVAYFYVGKSAVENNNKQSEKIIDEFSQKIEAIDSKNKNNNHQLKQVDNSDIATFVLRKDQLNAEIVNLANDINQFSANKGSLQSANNLRVKANTLSNKVDQFNNELKVNENSSGKYVILQQLVGLQKIRIDGLRDGLNAAVSNGDSNSYFKMGSTAAFQYDELNLQLNNK